MKKYIKYSIAIVLFSAISVLQSCSEDEGTSIVNENDSLLQVAKRTTAMSSFLEAIEVSGSDLSTLLNGNENYTIFAPTNGAFNSLFNQLGSKGYKSLADFDTAEEKKLLADLLKYHTVSGSKLSNTLSDGQVISTLEGEGLSISAGEKLEINDVTSGTVLEKKSEVVAVNLTARNGVIHFIEDVLFNQDLIDALEIKPTLTQTVNFEESLSQLKDALTKVGLAETLSLEGTLTVFAPNNDAFSNLFDTLGDEFNSLEDFDNSVENKLLENIILYHVLPKKVMAVDLAVGEVETSFAENTVEVIADGTGFVLGDASDLNGSILSADVISSNGVAHVIDKVLLPQVAFDFLALLASDNIVELASASPDLTTLVEAVVKTNLVEILSGTNKELDDDGKEIDAEPNFTYYNAATVFAPTNAAFTALFNELGPDYNSIADFDTDDEIELLKNILLYHVLPSEIKSADLKEGDVTTLKGDAIQVVQRIGNGFVIGDASNDVNAEIVTADVDAKNGVVHTIDKVLLPIELVSLLNK